MCAPAFAAAPTIEEATRLQFTAADQETTMKFEIHTIVWASFTGKVIVDTNVMNLETGDGIEFLKLAADAVSTHFVITFPKGIIVHGLKAEDLTNGYVTVFGKQR